MILESGTGNGKSVEVNDENMLMVKAVSASPEHHVNFHHGQSYAINFSATPTGAGDCFLYLKNENDSTMIVEGVGLWLVADEYVDIKVNDSGTPAGGTNITPTNLNTSSGNVAEGVFQHGNDITGLSGGAVAYRFYHASSAESKYINFEQDIIIPKNGVLTIYCQTGTTALAGYLDISYHNGH